MTIETALPEATTPEVDAGAGDQQNTAAPADDQQQEQQEAEQKPGRHPLEKELAKERRRISRLVEQREISRAEAANLRAELDKLRGPDLQNTRTDDKTSADDDPDVVRIPRSELPKLAERLQSEASERETMRKAAAGMRKALGDDFQRVTDELAEVFNADLQFAVAASEAPAELARYLTDPDNADEAERIARMSPIQAGRAMAKIEAKLAAKPEKPQPSKAPKPVDPVRGGGGSFEPDTTKMTDEQWFEYRRKGR
jgi:hypothetical protein